VPNDPVDKSSQESLACYPWRTFYSLSDDFSLQNHRITMADPLVPVWFVNLTVKRIFAIALKNLIKY